MESRSFAKIFFNMTGVERVSVAETSPFATPEIVGRERGDEVDPDVPIGVASIEACSLKPDEDIGLHQTDS
jgi:hypothetical protein